MTALAAEAPRETMAEPAAPPEWCRSCDEAHGGQFLYMCEELVFMRLVCRMDLRRAALALNRSERVTERYWAHVKADPGLAARVLRRYRPAVAIEDREET